VLRLPFVSKLHARFSFEDPQRVTVSDNDSANGTRVNGRLLKSPETCAIGPGDTVTFGSLELEVVSAQMAYEWLRSTPR
jgi:pSer/pThr/pTyr-binding forkhead associated (FHA) protein